MSLKSSRKVLCVMFSIIIAVGGLMTAGSVAAKCTIGSQMFMDKKLSSESVKKECDNNFKERLEVIADKSDIPVHVFNAVFDAEEAYSETLAKCLFTGGDTSMFSQDKVDLFETLCTEYLDGNNIKYSKQLVHNTAVEAAQAYSDSYGMYNTEGISEFITQVNHNYSKFLSTGLIMMAIGALLINLMFSESRDKTKYSAHGFTAAGLSIALTGIVGLISGIGRHAHISPQLYARVISRAVNSGFIIMIAIGVLILALSSIVTYKCFKEEDKEKRM